MDYLTRILKTLQGKPEFHYHPRSKEQKIVHLSSADDLLMFWLFIMNLAVNGRLATKDRLAKWGILQVLTRPLCQQMDEDHDHIFFQCTCRRGVEGYTAVARHNKKCNELD